MTRRPRSLIAAVSLALVTAGSGSLAGPVAAVSEVRFRAGPWIEAAGTLADFMPGLVDVAQVIAGPTAVSRGSDGRLTVLLVGSDYRPGSGTGERLDTIMVMTINPKTKKIAAVSIPRDTGYIPLYEGGTYKGKINGLFKYYKKRSGGSRTIAMTKFERTIEKVLAIQIDYHAFIRFGGFDTLVDEVGGVPTPIPLEIRDTGYIDKPGWPKGARFLADTTLAYPLLRGGSAPRCYGPYPRDKWNTAPNCTRALVYVRSRKGSLVNPSTGSKSGNNDWKRSSRQQDFIWRAIRRVTNDFSSSKSISLRNKANQIASDFYTNIPKTDSDVLYLYGLLKGSALTQQAVLKPKYYASRVPGTSKYKLNLTNVRKTTKAWFGPI